MKYIIMCGGNYTDKFKIPKQLMKVNGEVIIERTIRLLKENGIYDIALSTNGSLFDYLNIPILKHDNEFEHGANPKVITSKTSWLNAYYPTGEPCCYLHGDVYYSDEAIKTIVETEVKDTMFFCVPDLQDGRTTGVNAKGREPLAYKVQNQKIFRNAINELFKMLDEGKFENGVEPISWHLYRQINGLELGFNAKDYGFANNIFDTNGDYVPICDYSTDVDSIEDIEKIEKIIKINKRGVKMIKVKVIESFYLGRFNELRNIQRNGPAENGYLNVGDIFECTEEMAKYLSNEKNSIYPTDKDGKNNPRGRIFAKEIEVIPELTLDIKASEIKVPKVELKEEKTKKAATKKTTKKNTKKTTTKK